MIPLFKPFVPDLPDLDSILHSGALSSGVYTRDFENALKEYLGTSNLIVSDTFSNAVSIAITTLGLKSGDSVIASPMACLASMQPYLSAGIGVCWADVDPRTGTLSPESVASRITPSIKAIVHNHFCGYPGHIDDINEIGRQNGIPVIDDGIEAFGSEYHGKKIGNCGTDITIFSLTPVRFCNCINGGIVVFEDRTLYEKSMLVRDCGIDRSRFRDERGEISSEYDISQVGYSATMSNVNAYIGIKQMETVDDLIARHRTQAERWNEYFESRDRYSPIVRNGSNPNYWVYGILTDDKAESISMFRNEGYYASGVHIRNDRYSVFGNRQDELPGVHEFNERYLALPCGWWMP